REVILQARTSVPREVLLAPSSVNRLLHREGLMERADKQPEPKDRRRFAFNLASELWMSWERSQSESPRRTSPPTPLTWWCRWS
ncbi:MAG: hypothetical protein OXC19_03015, partial [Bryobacterales bacterium]|nr:hypothetical protein [Bryobacterales bacterium]